MSKATDRDTLGPERAIAGVLEGSLPRLTWSAPSGPAGAGGSHAWSVVAAAPGAPVSTNVFQGSKQAGLLQRS